MVAKVHNFEIEQGIPFKQVFVVKNADGSNKNLAGYSAKMYFKTSHSSTTVELDASTVNSKIVIDPINSLCTVELQDEDTILLTYQSYVYDIKLIDSNNEPIKLVRGSVHVIPLVTI